MPTELSDLDFFQVPKDTWLSHPEIFLPVEQNTVFTVDFLCTIPLQSVVRLIAACSLRKDRLSVVTIRWHERFSNGICTENGNVPHPPTVQLFGKGKAVLMGATSEYKTLLFCHKLRFMLLNMGLPASCSSLILRNKVCSGNYIYGIDTDNFEYDNTIASVKDDGTFPGIMFVITPPGSEKELRFSLFPTGKFIVMGMDGNEAREGFLQILPILHRNRRPDGAPKAKAARGVEKICKAMRKRAISEITNTSKEELLTIAKRVMAHVDYEDLERESSSDRFMIAQSCYPRVFQANAVSM